MSILFQYVRSYYLKADQAELVSEGCREVPLVGARALNLQPHRQGRLREEAREARSFLEVGAATGRDGVVRAL